MFTTGSKLFFGACAVSLVAMVVFGLDSDWNAFGVVLFGTFAVGAFFLGVLTVAFRDAEIDVPAAVSTSSADAEGAMHTAGPVVSPSGFPVLAGFGAGVVVLGLVLDSRVFIAGMFVLFAVVVEWMVKAWADRASGDATYNQRLRDRILQPVEFPIIGVAVAAVVVLGFSRVMLALPKLGSTYTFIAVGVVILVVAVAIAAAPRISKNAIAAVILVAAITFITGGVIGASVGERDELHPSAEEEAAHHEDGVADVSNEAGIWAEISLDEDGLTPGSITIPKGVTVTLLFDNETDEERQLVVDLGGEEPYETPERDGPSRQVVVVRPAKSGTFSFSVDDGGTERTGVIVVP